MQQKILFGTANQAKVDHIRAMTAGWPYQILSPNQLGITLAVTEDGDTVEENALKKARAFAAASQLPTFAIDAGLTIERFPLDKQPGVYVRRIHQQHDHVTDAEITAYYRAALNACGGTTPGEWQIAVALVIPPQQTYIERYTIDTLFTAQLSSMQIAGAPLSSLMCDPHSGRYYAEFAYAERPDSVQLRKALTALFRNL